jgi:cold shock CspA family protein
MLGAVSFAFLSAAPIRTIRANRTAESCAHICVCRQRAEGEREIEPMPTGILKSWFADRGFGFIKQDDGKLPDMFLHITALLGSGIDPDSLAPGDRLSYDVAPTRNGKTAATNVRRAP